MWVAAYFEHIKGRLSWECNGWVGRSTGIPLKPKLCQEIDLHNITNRYRDLWLSVEESSPIILSSRIFPLNTEFRRMQRERKQFIIQSYSPYIHSCYIYNHDLCPLHLNRTKQVRNDVVPVSHLALVLWLSLNWRSMKGTMWGAVYSTEELDISTETGYS